MQNRVSAEFTKAQRDTVLEAVQTIRDNMPFLTDASPEDWEGLNKLGPKSRAFAEASLTAAQQFTEHLPRRFEPDEFERDLALFLAVEPVYLALQDLFERVSDTRMLVGSDAMEAAYEVYHHVKGAPGASTLNETYDTLRTRFQRGPRRRDSPPAGGTPPADPPV